MEKRFNCYMNTANAITFCSAATALVAILFASKDSGHIAVLTLMFIGIADIFDGWVARQLCLSLNEQEFGKHLDSLVDVVAFGMLPAIIFYYQGMQTVGDIVLLSGFLLCSVSRLAFFNVHGLLGEAEQKAYQGLPVTYIAMILPLAYTLLRFTDFEFPVIFYRVLTTVTALAFILNIPVPKPRGVWLIIFPLTAFVLLFINLTK